MAAVWYYRDSETENGPFTALELRRLARDGDIGAETLVRRDVDGRWVLARKVRGLLDEAATEADGRVEVAPMTDAMMWDVFGTQTDPMPGGAAQTDEDCNARQELIPPPLPVTHSEPAGAVPAAGRTALQGVVRSPGPRSPPRAAFPGTPPPPSALVAEQKVWEYKVLTQKDKWFSGKFDPAQLEQALNAYAKQGWRLRGVATASIPALIGGARDEMIFVLER